MPYSSPVMMTRGNSSPFVLCKVMSVTASTLSVPAFSASTRSSSIESRNASKPSFVHGYTSAAFTSPCIFAVRDVPSISSCPWWYSSKREVSIKCCTKTLKRSGVSSSCKCAAAFFTSAENSFAPSYALFESISEAVSQAVKSVKSSCTPLSRIESMSFSCDLSPTPRGGLFTILRNAISSRGFAINAR